LPAVTKGWYVSEAARETAKELIKLQPPLNAIAEPTKLSLKVVESIKAEIVDTITEEPPK
jgi:hypothetical protein